MWEARLSVDNFYHFIISKIVSPSLAIPKSVTDYYSVVLYLFLLKIREIKEITVIVNNIMYVVEYKSRYLLVYSSPGDVKICRPRL